MKPKNLTALPQLFRQASYQVQANTYQNALPHPYILAMMPSIPYKNTCNDGTTIVMITAHS